jgi:hypothetical protein
MNFERRAAALNSAKPNDLKQLQKLLFYLASSRFPFVPVPLIGIGRVDADADDFILHETQKPYAVKGEWEDNTYMNGWVLFKTSFWGSKRPF